MDTPPDAYSRLRVYSPFELDAQIVTLEALDRGLSGIAMAPAGETTWLRDDLGETYPVHVIQRDLEFKFEVFTLSIPTRSELEAEVDRWERPSCRALLLRSNLGRSRKVK